MIEKVLKSFSQIFAANQRNYSIGYRIIQDFIVNFLMPQETGLKQEIIDKQKERKFKKIVAKLLKYFSQNVLKIKLYQNPFPQKQENIFSKLIFN